VSVGVKVTRDGVGVMFCILTCPLGREQYISHLERCVWHVNWLQRYTSPLPTDFWTWSR
jgi:hypothetical protein